MITVHPFFIVCSQLGKAEPNAALFQYLPTARWVRDSSYQELMFPGLYSCSYKRHVYRIHVLATSGLFLLSCDSLFEAARRITTEQELAAFLAECKFPI